MKVTFAAYKLAIRSFKIYTVPYTLHLQHCGHLSSFSESIASKEKPVLMKHHLFGPLPLHEPCLSVWVDCSGLS